MAPPDGEITVEHECCVRSPLVDEAFLAGPTVLTVGVPGGILRVEPQAPAPRRAERGVALTLDEPSERVPRVGAEGA
jgi:hypothetical protein